MTEEGERLCDQNVANFYLDLIRYWHRMVRIVDENSDISSDSTSTNENERTLMCNYEQYKSTCSDFQCYLTRTCTKQTNIENIQLK